MVGRRREAGFGLQDKEDMAPVKAESATAVGRTGAATGRRSQELCSLGSQLHTLQDCTERSPGSAVGPNCLLETERIQAQEYIALP